MKITKKLLQNTIYSVLVFLFLVITVLLIIQINKRYIPLTEKPPIIHDVHIINLDKSKDRWSNMKQEIKKLAPLSCIRWSATDGRRLTEEQMVQEGIPYKMLPSDPSVKQELKERRKGEIGCYLSHKKLLEYLYTLDVGPNVGHLILEDDAVLDDDILASWNESYKHVPDNWGLFYFGTGGNLQIVELQNGIAELKSAWGTFAYMVKHERIPEILRLIQPMYDPIDNMLQDNYTNLHTYTFIKSKVHQYGASTSTIWDGK